MIRKFYAIIILMVWLGVMAGLWQRFFVQRSNTTYLSLATGLKTLPSEMEWMNILMNGKKIGYSFSSLVNDDNGGYTVEALNDFNTVVAGVNVKISTVSHARIDSNFHYRSFDWRLNSGVYSTHILAPLTKVSAGYSGLNPVIRPVSK